MSANHKNINSNIFYGKRLYFLTYFFCLRNFMNPIHEKELLDLCLWKKFPFNPSWISVSWKVSLSMGPNGLFSSKLTYATAWFVESPVKHSYLNWNKCVLSVIVVVDYVKQIHSSSTISSTPCIYVILQKDL